MRYWRRKRGEPSGVIRPKCTKGRSLVSRLSEWWRDPDTTSVVTVGVGLLAVPTAFGVFGEISQWSLWVRVPIGLAWLVVAFLVVLRQHGHDRRVDQLVEGWGIERADEAVLAAQELLTAYLRPGLKGTPTSFRWSVHVYDEEENLLLPIYPESADVDDLEVFAPGDGAVGVAFAHQRIVVVTGDGVADESYRLSSAQQVRFAPYRTVVAAPLESAGTILGTLSAISLQDDGYFEDEPGPSVLRDTAGVVATLLVTMIGPAELKG